MTISYLLGIMTGFFLGIAVMAIPGKLKKYKKNYIELKWKGGRTSQ